MSESLFNAEEFLDQVTTEVNDTKVIPVPEDYYLGIAGKPRFVNGRKGMGQLPVSCVRFRLKSRMIKLAKSLVGTRSWLSIHSDWTLSK